MSTEPSKAETPFTEAPASWNTRYVTPEGFACQITLRGETGRDLLEKAGIALAYLLEHGYQPDHNSNRNGISETRQCPIHQCEMRRFDKEGRSWFSHRLDDGRWCRGRKR
jgi:hypothetical protein